MSKLLVLFALLCMFVGNIVRAENLELRLENPVHIVKNNDVYTLLKTNTSIHLNSTIENFKPCTVDIDPIKDLTIMKIQGKQLSDGKFVVWSIRSFNDSSPGIISINYTTLIVDPMSCSYKAVVIPEEKASYKTWGLFYARVVNTKDGFDFFYPRHGKCSPCRFSFEGETIPLEYQLEPEEEVFVPYGFNIQSVNETDLSKGYIYTLNFKNDTSLLKLLDTNFKVLKQVLLQHPIHSVSLNDEKKLIISICYASHNFLDNALNHNFKVHCEQLDSDLNSKLTSRLPVPDDQFVFGLTGLAHRVNSLGNTFIGLMQCTHRNGTTPATRRLRLFVTNATGKVVETIDYDKTDIKSTSEWFEVHIELSVYRHLCLFVYTVPDVSVTDTQVFITCADAIKYSEPRVQ